MPRAGRGARAAWLALGLAAAAALYLAACQDAASRGGLLALGAHAPLFLLALALLARGGSPRLRAGVLIAGTACAILGALGWFPNLARPWLASWTAPLLIQGHLLAGTAAVALAVWGWVGGRRWPAAARRWAFGVGLGLAVLAPAASLTQRLAEPATWQPPYEPEACYRFLTATTAVQSGVALFPTALQLDGRGGPSCQDGGCHAGVHAAWGAAAHAGAGASPAYRATYHDFVERRGRNAARWCQGCHSPEALREAADGSVTGQPGFSAGVTCVACHAAAGTPGLFGSAALRIGPGPDAALARLAPALRPSAHARQFLPPTRQQSAEFCAACHRKNWNLPQNGYRWLPGPDEYRGWQSSPYSGASLFAAGERRQPRSCVDCHAPHRPPRAPQSGMALDLFLRKAAEAGGGPPHPPAPFPSDSHPGPLDLAHPPAPGQRLYLDVVVANAGIGHDFPTGMPDLNETWLEVRVFSPLGRETSRNGGQGQHGEPDPGAHFYRLEARDRAGKPVRHGDLDRMVTVAEWRQIPAGESDLARYALRVPRAGLGAVSVRLLRRRRPAFSAWAGESARPPEVLAARRWEVAAGPAAVSDEPLAARWRRYGEALAAVKAYPLALQALEQSRQRRPADPETALALGRVYLEEGDLLAAREQFARARAQSGGAERAMAWEGAVLRRMGQPGAAAALLEPLAARHPRDRRLRFELGLAYMAELGHDRAARQFRAMLAVDPLDIGAHYNLMLCHQRLNELPAARREETIYHLLADDDLTTRPGEPSPGHSRSLLVHPLAMTGK